MFYSSPKTTSNGSTSPPKRDHVPVIKTHSRQSQVWVRLTVLPNSYLINVNNKFILRISLAASNFQSVCLCLHHWKCEVRIANSTILIKEMALIVDNSILMKIYWSINALYSKSLGDDRNNRIFFVFSQNVVLQNLRQKIH